MAEKDQSNVRLFYSQIYTSLRESLTAQIRHDYESNIGYKVHVSFDNTVARHV